MVIDFINQNTGCQSNNAKTIYNHIISLVYGCNINQCIPKINYKKMLDCIKHRKNVKDIDYALNDVIQLIKHVKQDNSNRITYENQPEPERTKVFEGRALQSKTSVEDLLTQLPANFVQRLQILYAEYLNTTPANSSRKTKYEELCKIISSNSYISKVTKATLIKIIDLKIGSNFATEKTSLAGVSVTNERGDVAIRQNGSYTMHFGFNDFVVYCLRYERSPIDDSKIKMVEI